MLLAGVSGKTQLMLTLIPCPFPGSLNKMLKCPLNLETGHIIAYIIAKLYQYLFQKPEPLSRKRFPSACAELNFSIWELYCDWWEGSSRYSTTSGFVMSLNCLSSLRNLKQALQSLELGHRLFNDSPKVLLQNLQ